MLSIRMFRNLAQRESGLNIDLPEIEDTLNKGYQRLLDGGEVTISRARDYLMGFRDGRSSKETKPICLTSISHDYSSD